MVFLEFPATPSYLTIHKHIIKPSTPQHLNTSEMAIAMDIAMDYNDGDFERAQDVEAPSSLECPICMESLGKIGVKALQCMHCFHQECIDLATKVKNACPICRTSIPKPIQAEERKDDPRIRVPLQPREWEPHRYHHQHHRHPCNQRHQVPHGGCEAFIAKGPYAGEVCGRRVKHGTTKCGLHKNV
jgi:hypothetical protein